MMDFGNCLLIWKMIISFGSFACQRSLFCSRALAMELHLVQDSRRRYGCSFGLLALACGLIASVGFWHCILKESVPVELSRINKVDSPIKCMSSDALARAYNF